MKVRGIVIGILLLSLSAFGRTRPFDIQLSYGGWSLSPFRSLVERECENLIRNEFDKMIGAAIPNVLLSPFLSSLDLSSSGRYFSLALWHRFGGSRFAAGVRGDYFYFRVPYSLSVQESIELPGIPLAAMDGHGRGAIRLNGLAVSLLGRWTALSTRRADVSLQAGLMMLPFRGRIDLDHTISVETPLGDLHYSGSFEHTFDEVRALGLDVPSLILSPSLGLEARCRLSAQAGIFVGASLSQGTFYSGGLVFSF